MVRVRFAPSPTGHLHIGGLRSAIFNWLFARHNNGTFLLRIEDTDKERSTREYLGSILNSFTWMSMPSDEPVVIQSQRFADHQQLIDQLLREGKAYRCFCTRTVLTEDVAEGGAYAKYDGTCREHSVTEDDLKRPYVVRFKLPKFSQEHFIVQDLIYGEVLFPIDQFDDFIIARSDGNPMYNFVVVADDIFMNITYIIRGQEHLVNTPKQIMLYQALNAQVPQFAHLPLILGPSGAKLSKREAAVSVLSYKEMGFLPDALFNYLVRLGWSHGDQEVFTREQLIEFFSLDAIHKKSAVFDTKKLEWLNGVYIRQHSAQDLLTIIVRDLQPDFRTLSPHWSDTQLLTAIDLYKERIVTLKELAREITVLHQHVVTYDEETSKPFCTVQTQEVLQVTLQALEALRDWQAPVLMATLKQLCTNLTIKMPIVAQPIRVALTGTMASPGIGELLALLGKEESMHRLKKFALYLNQQCL